jgi:NAD(P)-dependent dehydrogenase (short-subunit alcohol dehydrogenase family)
MAVSRTEAELAELDHPSIATFATSLATPEGCLDAIEATRADLGRIDILISNAGMGSAHDLPVWQQDPAHWRDSLAINLTAPFELIRVASPDMIERRWGRIVVVSSVSGLVGEPSNTAYGSAKHGVIGLVRCAALDLAPYSVTCNAVCPGWVRTRMGDTSAGTEAQRRGISPDEVWAERAASYAAGRVIDAEEVAAAIMFLASDAASGISGEAIRVALGNPW